MINPEILLEFRIIRMNFDIVRKRASRFVRKTQKIQNNGWS